MSNDLVLGEAGLRQVTYIIRERQLRIYGHVARLPGEDPANLILQYRDPSGWTIPRGRPHASFGGLSEGYGHDGPGICLGDGQRGRPLALCLRQVVS